MQTDLTLLENIKAGDSSSFDLLYEKYFKKIYNFVYLKTYNSSDSEDIVSDVFFKAFQNVETFKFEHESSFKGFLYRIAYNKVVDFYRTRKENSSIEEIIDFAKYEDDISGNIDNKDKLKEVMEFLNTIKKEHREVLIMRIWDDLSYREISEITSLSEANCKKIVSRTLDKVKGNVTLLSLLLIITNF